MMNQSLLLILLEEEERHGAQRSELSRKPFLNP